MVFVWSFWWIVIALLVLGIAGAIVGFVLMDKKDRVLIEEFKKQHTETPVEADAKVSSNN